MISKTLGTSSRKFARLRERHPDVGLFAQALYPLIVASADDFGRLQGDAFTVKHSVWSTAPDPESTFEDALAALALEGLVVRYQVASELFIEVVDFAPHQSGLHKRTESRFPEPSGKFPELPGDSLLREQNRTKQNRTKQNSHIVVDGGGFERFWDRYPKKVGKDAAQRAFDRRSPDAALLDVMLAALDHQRRSTSWLKDGGQFIPHPSTWLNQGRWMDETMPAAAQIGAARRWSLDACPHTPPCGNATNCATRSTVDAYKASR